MSVCWPCLLQKVEQKMVEELERLRQVEDLGAATTQGCSPCLLKADRGEAREEAATRSREGAA